MNGFPKEKKTMEKGSPDSYLLSGEEEELQIGLFYCRSCCRLRPVAGGRQDLLLLPQCFVCWSLQEKTRLVRGFDYVVADQLGGER